MKTISSPAVDLKQHDAWIPIQKSQSRSNAAPADVRVARAEALQKTGRGMVIAGFAITIMGVVLYCAVTFAGGMSAEVGDILFRNTVPFARGTLAVLGLGTLVWLGGSFTYLRGAMEADEDAGEDSKPG